MRRIAALALSTHPLPGAAVTAIATLLGVAAGLEPWRVVLLGLAFAANQTSVGLSNDARDAERDRAVGRTDKPVARGDISPTLAWTVAFLSAGLAIAMTVPLGWPAVAAHAVFLVSAWSYNLGLKSTALSVLPYLISFGLLPAIATLARTEPSVPTVWAIAAGALLGVAAHFANVLPDLADDAATGVRGLPHRLGRRVVGLTIAATLVAASACLVIGPGPAPWWQYAVLALSAVLAVACAVLVLSGRASRWMFRLIILAALIDVVLLVFGGSRLLR